jgi:hypothetical protein
MKWKILLFVVISFIVLLGWFREPLLTVSAEILDPYLDFLPLIQQAVETTPPPTPGPTQTPTSQPTETPTPKPEGVDVLPNYSYFLTTDNSFHIVGEIQNRTHHNVGFVKVSVNLFDVYDALIGTNNAFTYLWDLPTGEKTCFDIIFLDAPVGWSYMLFETSYLDDGDPLPIMTVFDDSGHYDTSSGDYYILGQVRNDQGSLVESVSPVGTLYDANNTVLGCGYTYVNSTDLEPGQESEFRIDYSDRDYSDVISYRIQVDGFIASR